MNAVLDFFFSPERPFSLLINLLIMGMGGAAVAQIIRSGFVRIRREQAALATAKQGARSANSAEEISELVPHLPEGSYIRNRVANLWRLKKAGDEINHDALAELVRSDLDGTATFGRWAALTVVLVGLAGTLIGLTSSVRSADVALRNIESISAALGPLLQTFDGIQVAFSTTLMGVLWAASLSCTIVFMRRQQEQYLRQLEEFTLVRLIPRFRTSAGLALVESARSLAALEQQLDAQMHTIVDELRVRGAALTSTIDTSFDKLTAGFGERSGELLQRFEMLQNRFDAVLGVPAEETDSLAANLAKLQGAVAAVQDVAVSVEQLMPQLEESIARQVDQQTRDLNEAMTAYTGRLSDSVEQQDAIFESAVTRISASIEDLKKSIPSLNAALSEHSGTPHERC